MYAEPRVWKWLLPAGAIAGLVPVSAWINMIADRNAWPWFGWCSFATIGLMPFLAVQAWAGFVAYYRRLDVDDYVTRRRADVLTPQNILASHMERMHPEAINVLKMYGRMTWMLLPGAKPNVDEAMWILYGTQVTSAFITQFLKTSTTTACVPMAQFSNDGAKLYAPRGMKDAWCTDRDQYRQLVEYLFGACMVTRSHGNMPAEFLPSWNPENVARAMGFELWPDDDEEDIAGQLSAVNK